MIQSLLIASLLCLAAFAANKNPTSESPLDLPPTENTSEHSSEAITTTMEKINDNIATAAEEIADDAADENVDGDAYKIDWDENAGDETNDKDKSDSEDKVAENISDEAVMAEDNTNAGASAFGTRLGMLETLTLAAVGLVVLAAAMTCVGKYRAKKANRSYTRRIPNRSPV